MTRYPCRSRPPTQRNETWSTNLHPKVRSPCSLVRLTTVARAALRAPELYALGSRTILVTGAARGLGLTIATALLESGADVVAFDILPPIEDEWALALATAKAAGTTITYTRLDVTDEAAVERAVGEAFSSARPGRPVSGLLHSAGIQLLKEALEVSAADWRKVVDVNLTGSFLVAKAFAANWTLEARDVTASVVFIASMSGRVANFGLDNAVYNASKGGVLQLTRNLAYEWGKKGIRVNSISPGECLSSERDARR